MFKKQQMTLKVAKISKAIEKIDGDMKFVGHEIKPRNPNQTLSKWFKKKIPMSFPRLRLRVSNPNLIFTQ